MKLTRKLFVSILAVAFALVALGTSTFAWFSMNTKADATGMEVQVKSNAQFLLIGDTAEIANNKEGVGTTVAAAYTTVGNDDKKCYPCAYTTSALTAYDNNSSVAANKWYYASSTQSSSATTNIVNYHEIEEGAIDYMLTYSAYLTLSKDSEDFTGQLKATFSKGANDDDSLSVCVKVTTTGSDERLFLNSTNTNLTTTGNITLTKDTAILVTVYVYVDGNSTNVNSDFFNNASNAGKLNGTAAINFDLIYPAA